MPLGITAMTQGPQGTVSSIVLEDERRISSLTTKSSIKSILALLVKNTFSEMRSGATDMPVQLEFDKVSAGQSRNGWRSNLFYTICLLHSFQVLLPTGFHHHTLQGFTQVMPAKGTKTIWKASEWNEELESNVWSEPSTKQCETWQPRNSAHKSAYSWLSDCTAAVPVPHRETTETFYKQSQIVCVRVDSSDTRQLFIMVCLQENVSVGT